MSNPTFKVGQILENQLRQFTKIISLKNGIYGISGWTGSREAASKATVAHKFVNVYGLKYANVKVVGSKTGGKSSPTNEDKGSSTSTDTPTKASINALSADDAKALCKKETGEEVSTGKEAKEKLVAFYKL